MNKKPISKKTVYKQFLINTVGMYLLVTSILTIFIFVITGFRMIVLLHFFWANAVILIPILLPTIKQNIGGLTVFRNQEQYLGFDFDTEMERKDIHQKSYESDEWFIKLEHSLVIRKDFIKWHSDMYMYEPKFQLRVNAIEHPRIDVAMQDGTELAIIGRASAVAFGEWVGAKWNHKLGFTPVWQEGGEVLEDEDDEENTLKKDMEWKLGD